jgi:cold shock CspA family protein
MTGITRHWNASKGYGKIAHGRLEFFVHRTDLIDVAALTPGQIVEFEPTDGPRGPRAVDVQPIERAMPNPPSGPERRNAPRLRDQGH